MTKQGEKVEVSRGAKIAAIAISALVFLFIIIGVSGGGSDKSTSITAADAQPTTSDTKPVAKEEPSVPAEYKSALVKANSYANNQDMSRQGVYDQLVSEYGEKFSKEAAQYAIDNVTADWNANALAKAKSYQEDQNMSPASIHDQLTSQYGERFTQTEADYAIAHLNE